MKQTYYTKAIRILLYTNGLVLLASSMLGPIYALFVEEVEGSLLDASFAYGVFALVAGITTIISGKFTDKIKENELILVIGYLIMGLGFLSYLFVDSTFTLLLTQVVIGFGEALYAPAFDSIFSNHLVKKRAGSIWGTWEAMNYFTLSIGLILGGAVVSFFGFDVLFILMCCMSIFASLYIFLLPRNIL